MRKHRPKNPPFPAGFFMGDRFSFDRLGRDIWRKDRCGLVQRFSLGLQSHTGVPEIDPIPKPNLCSATLMWSEKRRKEKQATAPYPHFIYR
jgi:hypothetical protein